MDWTEAISHGVSDASEPASEADEARRAFVTFVEKHRDQAYRVARGMMPTHEAADDVLQDALLRAYRSLDSYRRDAELDTWLYRIVMNAALNELRARQRRGGFLERLWRHRNVAAARPQQPDEPVERHEARAHVQAAVMELNANLRAVVVLFDLEGLSCAEVSEALEIPQGTVRSRLHNARSQLRVRLGPYVNGTTRRPPAGEE
jgi:RNA polymerase sigma-70 factor, ECF subfamily